MPSQIVWLWYKYSPVNKTSQNPINESRHNNHTWRPHILASDIHKTTRSRAGECKCLVWLRLARKAWHAICLPIWHIHVANVYPRSRKFWPWQIVQVQLMFSWQRPNIENNGIAKIRVEQISCAVSRRDSEREAAILHAKIKHAKLCDALELDKIQSVE